MSNDRFKFRVWDKLNQKYFNREYEVNSNDVLISDHPLLGHDGCLWETEDFIIGCARKYHINDYIIEQCTGLRDKDLNLIYEGDKVIMTEFYFDGGGESERNFVGYVMWNRGEFVLSENSEIIEYSEKVTDVLPHLSWGHSFEVIGNIHEVEQ